MRTDKFFFGNISGSFISGSNGLLQISSSLFSVDPQGNITSSGGTIGGSIITSTTLKSNTNLSSPDSAPAFQINSNGSISGSDLYVRKVFEDPSGGPDKQFELIDTVIGKSIARNIGRQIVSDTTEYERKNVNDSGTYHDTHTFITTLLPFEDTILIYADVQTFNSDSSGTVNANARFTIARSVTGSYEGSDSTELYDEFETATILGTFEPGLTAANDFHTISAGPAQNEINKSITLEKTTQAKITLQLSVASATPSTSKGIKIKNISIIATSDLAASFPGPTNPITR